MGLCTSKPSLEPKNISGDHQPVKNNGTTPARDSSKLVHNGENPKNEGEKKKEEVEEGKKIALLSVLQSESCTLLVLEEVSGEIFGECELELDAEAVRPFPPPSPAKHIRALLARRHDSVKPNEAAIPEGNEVEDGVAGLNKSFGFSKHFGNKYEHGFN